MKQTLLIILVLVCAICVSAQNDILSDLDPAKFHQDFSEYDQSTALFLAQASEAAYWNEYNVLQLEKDLKEKHPTANFHLKLIDDRYGIHHNQVLLMGTMHFLVVAFRGTEPSILKDWLSDSKFWNYENTRTADEQISGLPPGHGGFRRAMMRLLTEKKLIGEIQTFISFYGNNIVQDSFPVFLTGHSLGAALAQMFIMPLEANHLKFAGAYHFAPPLAVSCNINELMKSKYGNKVYDIVNYKDYIPRAGRNNVAHFGIFYRICNDGLIYKEQEAYVKFNFREYFSEFELHSLDTHIFHIRKPTNNKESITMRSIGHSPCMELTGKPKKLCD